MSRSRRHTPICGIAVADSDKDWKRSAARRVRRENKIRLEQGKEMVDTREVTNSYTSNKDGKQNFDPEEFPSLMRK